MGPEEQAREIRAAVLEAEEAAGDLWAAGMHTAAAEAERMALEGRRQLEALRPRDRGPG